MRGKIERSVIFCLRLFVLSIVIIVSLGITSAVKAGFSAASEIKLIASDGLAGDNFGFRVSVSGDTLVIGAPNKDSNKGAAYVFVRNGTTWVQQAKLSASDGVAGDYFGVSVFVAGDTALVTAMYKDGEKGAAYVFTRSGATWSQQAKLTASDVAAGERFGYRGSISGDTIVLSSQGGSVFGVGLGAIYVFVRSGTAWTQQARLTANDSVTGDKFEVVVISGDTIIVGNQYKDSNRGAAYIFVRSGTTWSQQAKLTASDGVLGDLFGNSVFIDRDTAIVGSLTKNNKGAAYVFVRNGTTWSQQAILTASDAAANNNFGIVAVGGDIAVVGAMDNDNSKGAVYVYSRNGTAWVQQTKVTASDAAANDRFGYGIAISGDTVVAGAASKDNSKGAVYVYRNTAQPVPSTSVISSTPSQPPITTTAPQTVTSTTTLPVTTIITQPVTTTITTAAPSTTVIASPSPPITTSSITTKATTPPPVSENGEEKSGTPVFVWFLLVVAVLAGLGVTALFINRRNQKGSAPIGSKIAKVSPPSPVENTKHPDYSDTFKKLADLRKQGLITEEEFAAKKKDLLDKMGNSG